MISNPSWRARHLISILSMLVLSITLTACGGGGGSSPPPSDGGSSSSSSSGASSDTTQPTATILFPPRVSLTDGDTVVVRGTASDAHSLVSSVSINGISATSSDSFANWQATVPLTLGSNTLLVQVRDSAGNANPSADQIDIRRSNVFLRAPGTSLAVDNTRSNAYVIDHELKAVIKIDLSDGNLEVLSDDLTPDASLPLTYMGDIAVDSTNNRLLALKYVVNFALLAINLDTGKRSVISDPFTPGNHLTAGAHLVVDSIRNRLLSAQNDLITGDPLILAVNLDPNHPTQALGERTVLSSDTVPDANNLLPGSTKDFSIDPVNNRALIIGNNRNTSNPEMLSIDLDTGARTLVSNETTPNRNNVFVSPLAIAVDTANQQALVIDFAPGYSDIIVQATNLDPTHPTLNFGERTILSENAAENSHLPLLFPRSMTFDSTNSRALISDKRTIQTLNPISGERSLLVNDNNPNIDNNDSSRDVFNIAYNADSNRAIITQNDKLLSLDLNTGERKIISDTSGVLDRTRIVRPQGLAINPKNDTALLLVNSLTSPTLLSINLTSGQPTIISDNTTPNSNTPFAITDTADVAYDAENDRALVLSKDQNSLIAINLDQSHPTLTYGERSVLSDNSIPNNHFSGPKGIVIDSANNRALITNTLNAEVLAVDLNTGMRSVVSDASTPNSSPFSLATNITLSADGNSAYTVGSLTNITVPRTDTESFVTRINLSDSISNHGVGEREIFSNNTICTNNKLISLGDIELDPENNRLLVVEKSLGAILAIDLENGQRVILSK